jgi:hypothetical protein
MSIQTINLQKADTTEYVLIINVPISFYKESRWAIPKWPGIKI